MEKLYPLKLSCVLKSPIWSGEKLKNGWGKHSDSPIGESWELSVRKNENSVVENGSLSGRTLASIIDEYGPRITAGAFTSKDFPLLVKLIDAGDDLSVQVHPNDDYAARVEADRGKTEMWYIVEADEGARIVFGLGDGATKEELSKALTSDEPERLYSALRYIPVKADETYFIPAGLPHAIGKGILIAEIQQNCDLTYRVYDYGRLGLDGKPRELHVKKALDVIRDFEPQEIEAIRFSRKNDEAKCGTLLADCEFFRVLKLDIDGTLTLKNDGKMLHLLVLGGNGAILHGSLEYPLERGSSYLLPAELSDITLRGSFSAVLSSPNL